VPNDEVQRLDSGSAQDQLTFVVVLLHDFGGRQGPFNVRDIEVEIKHPISCVPTEANFVVHVLNPSGRELDRGKWNRPSISWWAKG
jgi:hypothetical protein